MPRWKSAITITVSLLLVGLLGWGCYAITTFELWSRDEIDHTARWSTFYSETMSKSIVLPDAASPIRAIEFNEWVDTWYEVDFTVPATKKPEEWLAKIAKDSGIEKYRRSSIRYDAGFDSDRELGLPKKMDLFEITYDPAKKTYRAFWGSG